MLQHNSSSTESYSGILLIDKPTNKTSFSLVAALRRLLKVKKIGHAGTLDPFATGVMVLLIGKQYTRLSDQLLCVDKEYLAQVRLGIETDSYDCDGQVTNESPIIPSNEELLEALAYFQGDIEQIPPMFSAKKQNGKKLYELARQGITVERQAAKISLKTELITYTYPFVEIRVKCSKGTYIRSIAQELGQRLGCFGHLSALRRTRSGSFLIENCIDGSMLDMPNCDVELLSRALIKELAN
ncbi:MAG: tRNA pseudouridine(55) synthase TruB [Parachlamydiaceae bacterium]|nr:tRNA pseudouridine(55) synthase TruB [Parachlamydiaceae bacterium]